MRIELQEHIRRIFSAMLVGACALLATAAVAKDGVVEINGVVQTAPASTLIGGWTIAARQVRTDASTIIKQQLGAPVVGAIVEVKGAGQPDGSVLAASLEVTQAAGGAGGGITPPVSAGEVNGLVETLPAAGLVGTWRVASRNIVVLAATRIDTEHGGVAIGTRVEVHGTANADGSVTAGDVEVQAGGTATPPPAGGDLEVHGTIDALPAAGPIGIWTVNGAAITVTAATTLNAEHGAFVLASPSRSMRSTPDGTLVARRIESRAGTGAPVPGSRFWGKIVALPAVGLTGIWKVDGRNVDVTAATEIHLDNGPVAVGAIVEVSGFAQPDGVILAREIETRAAIGVLPGQAASAVEFRNARLGHFFITASAAEIAALDSGMFGGEWKRTGKSFKVGGTQAVCRFYGMPPKGPDSHFFTSSEAECEHVMVEYAAWTFEDHAFAITPALPDGSCPPGLVGIHRFFNMPRVGADMNHRYDHVRHGYRGDAGTGLGARGRSDVRASLISRRRRPSRRRSRPLRARDADRRPFRIR